MKMLSKNEIKDADKAKGDSMSYKESYQKWADFQNYLIILKMSSQQWTSIQKKMLSIHRLNLEPQVNVV
jgi:hypothetical protein